MTNSKQEWPKWIGNDETPWHLSASPFALLQYEGCQEEGNDSGGNPIKNINEADTSP